jgi:hypothetical protein
MSRYAICDASASNFLNFLAKKGGTVQLGHGDGGKLIRRLGLSEDGELRPKFNGRK